MSGYSGEARQPDTAVLDEIISKATEFELAAPPPALIRCRDKLRENSYKVLVVGEAKRGKSTFVNALVGRDILPTDVDVATSQVFSIRPSSHESCRLRFEDGSAREIPVADVSKYGSQVMVDAGVVPAPEELIRWIEVDAPIQFLPKGVSILDTPGLGALYAGHARITHRFVPEADAVVFVLESSQPVIADDLKFIEQILTVTNNIFFIQTKIDQYSRDDWQSIQRRNEETLAQKFGGRLADTLVWPISSTNLRMAASVEENRRQVYLMASRYNELKSALEAFLHRVSGRGREAEATAVAANYHATSRKALAGRLAGLTAESQQQQAELQKIAVEGKRRFDSEWGVQGQKYRELREGLQRATAVGKQSFSNVMQPGGDIEVKQKAKIVKVKSLKQANRVAEEMPGEIMTTAINEWARICDEVQRRCIVLLGPFADAVDEIGAPVDPSQLSTFPAGGEPGQKFKRDYFTAIRGAAGGGMLVLGMSGMASLVAPSVAVAVMASTVMPFVAVPVLVVLFGGGVTGAFKGQVTAAQQQLRVRLAEQFQTARRYFFDVDLTSSSYSRVDEYFRDLDMMVNEYVRELVEKKSKESQAEIERLKEAMQLGRGDREDRTRQLQAQLAVWDNIGKSLGGAMGGSHSPPQPAAPARA
ncbi:MAG: dynamin family protein [Actinomycetota bacterium]|nr:dynamin family protein [Actinomycetota bacterium]